jgi:hypothetical protein
MPSEPEINFPRTYRGARKAFITACQKARADSIARVHPSASGPNGNPLFIDSVALGPRGARKALLLIAGSDGRDGCMGSGLLTGLLEAGIRPPADARLVMIHALNPFGTARGLRENEDCVGLDDPGAAQSWSFAMLGAILTEDLAHVEKLRVLDLARGGASKISDLTGGAVARAFLARKPGVDLRMARLVLAPNNAMAESGAVVTRVLAGL